MYRLLLGFALAALSSAAPAALITTGTISGSGGQSALVTLPMYGDPGRYRATLNFSAPGEFYLRYGVVRTTSLFCDFGDGNGFQPCGGDDVPIGFDVFTAPDSSTTTLFYTIAAPFREVYGPNQYGLVSDHADGASFEFRFTRDGSISYSAVLVLVPEPTSWALMITGFAAAGIAARRQARMAPRSA